MATDKPRMALIRHDNEVCLPVVNVQQSLQHRTATRRSNAEVVSIRYQFESKPWPKNKQEIAENNRRIGCDNGIWSFTAYYCNRAKGTDNVSPHSRTSLANLDQLNSELP